MPQDDAIARLAKQIDAARKSERFLVNAEEVAALRRRGAAELHKICAEFVSLLNSRLSGAPVDLAPATFTPEMFREPGVNLFQVGVQGREMQITFQSPPQLFSTDKYLMPYVLEGEVRTFNQEMLERFEIRSQLLFFCLNDDSAVWRYSDLRDFRTAVVDAKLLASLMGRLF